MMRLLRTLAIVLGAVMAPALAFAQSTVLQGGAWTPGHVPQYVGQGSQQPVIMDGGGAAGGGTGANISELGIVARSPTNTYPSAGQGTGPLGTNACDYDAPLTNATGYHYLCFSPNAQGGGLIAFGAGGTAAPTSLNFNVNGSTYQFPFTSGGGIVGPVSTTVGHLAVWNNTIGTALADAAGVTLGQLPSIGANTVLGSISGGSPIALTTTQFTTLCNAFTSSLSGCAPASGGGTSNFLRADGSWAAPSTSLTIGSSSIFAGSNNGLLYNNGSVVGNIVTANNGVVVTSGAGVPAVSSTLPAAVQANITGLVNANFANVAADTLKCNPTTSTAIVQDCTLSQLVTLLESSNNSAPNLAWYKSVDISHASDFGTPLWQIISEGTQNAFVAQAIQDQGSEAFQTAVTAYGRINGGGAGNYVYGLFGKVSVNATNGSATNEVDCENLLADSPNTFPYVLGFPVSGAYCVGLQSANIGAHKGHTAFYAVADSAPWRVAFYSPPTTIDATNPTSDIAGIWIDASATKSPVNSAIFKNTGLSSNIPVIIQTLGTYTKANAVLNVLDLNNNVVTQFRQDGGLVVVTSPSAASTDPVAWSLTNNSGGSGVGASASMTVASTSSGATSGANLFATTSAGTLTLGAASSATNTAQVRWTGIGTLFFDALNATGNMAFRTGATPTNAITISASQVIAVPAVATGTPAASLCIDASNNIIKKTTAGSCI